MADKKTSGSGGKRSRKDGPSGGKLIPGGNNRTPRTLAFWLVLFLLFIVFYQLMGSFKVKPEEFSYSRLKSEITFGNVASVLIEGRQVSGELKEGGNRLFVSYIPFADDPQLLNALEEAGVEVEAKPSGVNWLGVSLSWLPMLLFIGFWLFIMRQMQGGGNKVFSFGKSKAKLLTENRPKVTFDDVAGADEAKEELQEIIEFLKEPQKFRKLGGKIPKGALLLGPPGTGKTLLARAVAGEARVPFFSMSGSDFVEMFVGVGASRVRDLFEQGKKNAPCILFIDEIDAVGRHRGAGLGGGHDEREQTLNQLLVEMDGFESNEGVILIAATNRPDVLDPALLRPGRFDRQIVVDRPDVMGREGILKVHIQKVPLDKDVNLNVLARGTPGLSGADLANLVNEAALLAARRNQNKVRMIDFEDSKDKVMMGMERKSLIISDEEKKSTAYHESGHVLVSKKIPGSDPVHKVTIIPRGRALGLTHFLPLDEQHTYTRDYCLAVLAKMLGGRAADELVGNQPTTGAGDDIDKATVLARKMVCDWGMSDKLGPVTFGKKGEEIFLGREISQHRDYSEKTAQIIDEEVKDLVKEAHDKAVKVLADNVDTLDRLAEALLEREILDMDEIDKLIAGEKLPPLKKKTGKTAAPAKAAQTRKKRSTGGKKAGASLAPQPAK